MGLDRLRGRRDLFQTPRARRPGGDFTSTPGSTIDRRYTGATRATIQERFVLDAAALALQGWEPISERWRTGYRPLSIRRIGVTTLVVQFRARPGALPPASQPGDPVAPLFLMTLGLLLVVGVGLVLAIVARG
jgi:hypothetical protein